MRANRRIVSLLPSATEIVWALGFGAAMVGRSHECDFPAEVRVLPGLTEPKLNPSAASAEIDRQVKALAAQALSVYRLDAVKLAELRPELIVTQAQCEVCAVSVSEVEEAVSQWVGTRPTIVSLAPNSLSDVLADIERVAWALGAGERGRDLATQLRGRIQNVAVRTQSVLSRPGVALIEWIEPLIAAGNWMPEMVEMAGGASVFGQAGAHSARFSVDELCAKDPEIILVVPCGFEIPQSLVDLAVLSRDPRWRSLRAVRQERVFVADGSHYFNRPGPRLVESLEMLAEMIHPELFHFGHEGKGWRRQVSV